MILRVLNSNFIYVGRKVQKQPPEVFCRNNLKISQNLQENICARVSFLIKLQACNFIKKEILEQVFSCKFCKVFMNIFLQNSSGRLLLQVSRAGIQLDIREECDLAVETFCRHRRFTFKKYLLRSYYSILFLM